MCGIAGYIGKAADRQLAGRMAASLAHRGPDDSGVHLDRDLVLAHTRLSIIDLATGDQPMANEDGSLRVVYNGEIYNYRELTARLRAHGHRFATTSDTEVLLHGYEQWGPELLTRLNGIFAFALWDRPRRRLLLARDHFGVKPLHYRLDGSVLWFASEAKAILQDPAVPREADLQALHYFLNLRYVPGERTLFEGVRKLPPGHRLIHQDGRARVERYYHFQPPERPLPGGEEDFAEGIRHHLDQAVRRQLVSDVPLGAFLSGGLDSSSLVALMGRHSPEPVRTFSLGFNEPTDELDDARGVAEHFGADHHEMRLSPRPLRDYPLVIWAVEEPKENILQGYLLSAFARRSVKVVLSGLGGDELFAGYLLHRFLHPSQRLHRWTPPWLSRWLLRPLSSAAFRLGSAWGRPAWDEYRRGAQLLLAVGDPSRYYQILRNAWDFDAGAWRRLYGPAWREREIRPVSEVLDPFFPERSRLLGRSLWAEMNTKLVDDFLKNEDANSMAHGLEARVPMLDKDLVEYAFSIPPEMHIRGNETKHLLKKAVRPLLPEWVLRKKKWGFSFNPYHQFQKDLKPAAEAVLTRERVEARGWFNHAYLRRILDHPPHPRLRWHYFFLWQAMGLELWARMFLDGEAPAAPGPWEEFG
jgi:asparagine synthase (glutamine-hydrolysing)